MSTFPRDVDARLRDRIQGVVVFPIRAGRDAPAKLEGLISCGPGPYEAGRRGGG
jgi:hypothetical protein